MPAERTSDAVAGPTPRRDLERVSRAFWGNGGDGEVSVSGSLSGMVEKAEVVVDFMRGEGLEFIRPRRAGRWIPWRLWRRC